MEVKVRAGQKKKIVMKNIVEVLMEVGEEEIVQVLMVRIFPQ